MAEDVRMTQEQLAGGEAAGASVEAKSDTPFGQWVVFRGRLENRLELGQVKGKKLADYFKAVSMPDGENLPPVLARIEIPRGDKEIVLELDSGHPKSKSSKEVSVTEWVEQAAVTSAKLDFLSKADGVPYPIREEAKGKNRLFTGTANEALRIVQKEGRETLTRQDIKRIFPEGMSRRKFIAGAVSTGAALILAACGGLEIFGPGTSTPQIPDSRPTASEPWTPTPDASSTPSATGTPEATTTPEIVAADPTNIESWPAWARDFFTNHPEDVSQDARFQEFLDLSRRDYLQKAGVEGVETMNSEQLMREMIRQSAIEQRPLVLAPTEIIRMMTDHGQWMRPHLDPMSDNGWCWYNLWEGTTLVRDPRVAPTPPINEAYFQHLQGLSYGIEMFGRDVIVAGLEDDTAAIDFSGVVRLPGGEDLFAILMRYVDVDMKSHYRLYRLLNEPTTFNSGNQCIVDEALSSCPLTIEGGGIRIATRTSGAPYEFARHIPSDLLTYLGWPPKDSYITLLVPDVISPVIPRVYDPGSGLPIADFIRIHTDGSVTTPQNP